MHDAVPAAAAAASAQCCRLPLPARKAAYRMSTKSLSISIVHVFQLWKSMRCTHKKNWAKEKNNELAFLRKKRKRWHSPHKYTGLYSSQGAMLRITGKNTQCREAKKTQVLQLRWNPAMHDVVCQRQTYFNDKLRILLGPVKFTLP